jgi:hypothetical protein
MGLGRCLKTNAFFLSIALWEVGIGDDVAGDDWSTAMNWALPNLRTANPTTVE